MYLIGLQAIFASLAWRKGWRWKTLIPILCGFVLSFGLGIVAGLTGHAVPAVLDAIGFFVNAFVLCAIAIMVIKPPRSAKGVDAPPSALAQDLAQVKARPEIG